MTITKTIKSFLLLSVFLLLLSCEGYVSREWSVHNHSSSTIQVKAAIVNVTDTTYQVIEPGDARIITITTEDRSNSEPQMAYDVFTFLQIVNADTLTADIDWTDNDSWEIYIEQTKSKPDHFEQTYDLMVSNDDFE